MAAPSHKLFLFCLGLVYLHLHYSPHLSHYFFSEVTVYLCQPGKPQNHFILSKLTCNLDNSKSVQQLQDFGNSRIGDAVKNHSTSAGPIVATITNCGPPVLLPDGVPQMECCPPLPKSSVKDFTLPSSTAQLRVRKPVHLLDHSYVAKYSKAVELMKALPDDDPRSFKQQAKVHCAYCNGAYTQGGANKELFVDVHNGWLFFPFHRWFLYFHEKILGKLINDPDFALPFWNFDSPVGMQLPSIYANFQSPLFHHLRNSNHKPPRFVDLEFDSHESILPNEKLLSRNLALMYRQMVSNAKTAPLFLGNPFRAGDKPSDYGGGSVEYIPHNSVHSWVGDNTKPNFEDMGSFYSAARDPVFYALHSNLDRLWTVWKTLGGENRKDFDDPDWLNATFEFYDENADLVRVKIRDCLNITNLGYAYQTGDMQWLTARPMPRATKHKSWVTASTLPRVLESKLSTVVKRPKILRSKVEKEREEEILVIEFMAKGDGFLKFDVFVNDEADVQSGPENTEFAGSFVSLPHPHKHEMNGESVGFFKTGITEIIEDLDADEDESVLITVVPRSGVFSVRGIYVEYGS